VKRLTLERAIEENGATLIDEEVVTHTGHADKNTIEARVILVYRDKDGTEWEYNDVRKFRLKKKNV
jgi:hypothetical protein